MSPAALRRAIILIGLAIALTAAVGAHQAHARTWRHHPRHARHALRERSVDLRSIVTAAAMRNGVPVAIAHAVVTVESGWSCRAENGIASGIAQVRPSTARSVGVYGDLHDCRTGAEAGMRYLALALRAGGRSCAGLSLYNAGVGGPRRCTGYGRRVLAAMARR